MAGLAATVLQKAIFKATQNFMKFETRRPDLGLVEAYDKYKDMVVPTTAMAAARASASRPLEISVLKRKQTEILEERSPTLTGGNSESARVPLNFKTFGFEVGLTRAVNADNDFSATEDLANQIEQGIRDMLIEVDEWLAGVTELSKYSALPASSLMNVSAGAYETTTKDIFVNLPAVMRKLMLRGPYQMMTNVESLANFTNMSTYGAQNARNLEKLLAGYEFTYSHNLTPGAGNKEVYFATPVGSLAIVPWVEWDARNPPEASNQLGYGTMEMEFASLSGYNFNLPMGYMMLGGPQDKSAIRSGLERAYTQAWGFFVDLAAIHSFSSEAGKSPIVKYNASDI
ncbi:hypothetical protein [Tellurirhabdus bombi]|uniref:hypothetical protein n=1 Tax=Tellurirhabdus bombi TaxID=2907205 RepID=UPI001F237102|nr:hypothetical protein [Tellurirhabdus bombi]